MSSVTAMYAAALAGVCIIAVRLIGERYFKRDDN